MEDKELLAAWEKIGQIYGPQKRTYDEFKFQMQSGEYRKKVFNNLGDNAKSVWGYDNYDQFNADKFQSAPTLSINNVPESADNLPRFNASSSTFVNQTTDIARKSSNPKLSGGTGPGGNSRRVSPRTQAIIDSNKSKKEEAKKQASLERAKVAAATTSDLVTQKADFYDVLRNYSNASGNELFASQLDYNNDKLTGVEKGDFEQKAINFLSEDMFSVVDDTENSQVWKEYGDEYGFLINQLNSQGKEIKILQDQLGTETDPTRKQDLIDEINDIMSEGADYKSNKPTQTGVSNKIYKYGSYEDMQERFSKLNSLPEFKNYQRAINILGKVREVSENFDTRNPEWVENQKNLKGAQAYVDMKDKYDLPDAEIPGQMPQPKWFKNNISKPIVSSLAKGVNDILSLPRTLSFNDEYGWTDSLAEASERIFSKEKNPNMVAQLGQSSNKDRGLSERVAMVDDYQLVVDDNIGAEFRSAKTVRDKDGYLVQDNEIVKQVIEKYEANPEEYKSEQQYNLEGALPKFVGVMADLGVLMFGTKGLGTGVKATGALAKGSGLTRAGNYLSKSTVANRIGLTGAVTGQTHNQLYGEAIRQGMTPAEASAFAVTGSLAVAAVAQINPQFYLIGEKKAASKLTERYIAYLAQGGKESKSTAFKYAMKEVFGAGKREMLEELAEIPALNAVRGGFNQVMSPEKSFEIEWSRGEIEESAIFGLAAGTATGPMNITSQSSLQQQATYASYKAKEKFFERLDNLVGKQYIDPESGNTYYYTKEQAEAKKAEFSNLFKQLDAAKLSTNKLSEESESKLLSLFQSSNNVKRLMDNAEGNPALMKVLEAQYALTNDAIAEELENNKKQPKVEPKTEGESSVPTELTEERKSEMDSFLDNDSELELNGTVKPDPKVEGDQKTETKEERYNDSQIPVSQQKITYEDGNGETNIATVTTQLDGSRKVQISDEKGAVFSRETISKDNTLTNEEYVSVSTEGDVKQTEDVDIKSVINPKLESRMSDRQRKEAGLDVTPNSNPKIEGDQNTKSDFNENIVPGHFTMLYNDAFGIKVYGPKDKNGTKDLDKAVNRAMKESKTYQEALGKLKKLNPKGEIKQDSNPKPLFTKEEVTTAKADGDYLTPLIKRLKENFPGVEVVVDSKAVEDLALSQGVSPEGAKTARGVFDATNNRVLINPKTANKDTPIHEFGHVWTRLAKQERKELWDKGMSLIGDSDIVKNLRKQIAQNPDLQKVYTEDKILDEALAIAIGQRGAKIFESQEAQGIWDNWIKEFFDFIKNKFNVKSEGDIENLTLREFIELASTEILTGEKIVSTESKVEPEVKVDDNGQTLLFQANFLDPQTGLLYSYDKNGKKFKLLEAFGDITRDKELEYFADKHMVLHTPDFAFSGQISAKNGEIIVEGKGGMYYPIKFHEKGFFWASTESGADSLVKTLNESLKKNPDGKIYMGLVTAQASKLLSSTTASNAVVDIFTTKTFIDGLGLNKSQVNRALVNAANDTTTKKTKKKDKEGNIIKVKGKPVMIDKITGLRANTKNRSSVEDNLKLIRTKLANDKSSFEDRKFFVQSFLDRLAQNVNPKALDAKGKMKFIKSDKTTKTNAQVFKFFKDTIGYDQMTGTGGRISKANLTAAVSYMLGEPLLRGEAETNKIYAVVEIDTKLSTFKSDAHESYPKAIGVDPKKTNSRTKLHILKDRKDWRDHIADPETDTNIELGRPRKKDGKARSYIQILPTTVGLTYAPVRILNKSENPGMSFQLDDVVSEADVVNESDLALFSLPTTNKITQEQVDEALSTDKTSQRILAKGINPKTGDNVGVRLNLNVFKNTKVPVQTVHKGSKTDNYKKVNGVVGNFKGEALTYKAAVTIKDAHFNTHQKSVYEVKNKIKNKFPLASVDGKYQDIPLDEQNYSGVEIGFNPMKNSLFVDTDGKPVKRADEVTIVGTKVYARGNVEYFTEENKPEEFSPSFQLDGDTNRKQVYDAITKFKELGKFTEGEIVQYFNQRFPDISVKELGEMYTGKVPEDSPRSEKRKYTSRLEQVLSEETFEQISDEAKTYIPKRNNITQAEADFMFENLGLEDSVVIIKSNPDWLLPEVRIALTNKVITALEAEIQKLRTEGKDSEANLISASINNIVEQISKEGTKAGRFIQAFSLLKALSADRTVSLVNKKLKEAGKQPLTKDEETELKRLKNNSEDAAEGLPKSEAMAIEYKYIQNLLGSNFKDVFVAYFYASILSGVPTQVKNIFANVMSISHELFVTSLREAIKGNPDAIFQAPLGMIKGLSKGWLNAKHILETGVKSDKSNKFDNPTLLEWWRFNTNNTVIGKLLPKKVTDSADWLLNSKFLPWSPNFLKYVQRAMVAGDQLFFHSAKEMQARALAYRIKKGKNVTPEDIKRAETIINPSKDSLDKAKAEARLENYKDGTTQFKIRVHELMEANRDMTVQGQSEDFAAKTTFNYEPEGGLSYLYNFIVQSRQMDYVGPVMTTFIPFARVLTNVFNRFLHYTPIGAITAARGKVRMASGKTRILSSEEKADLYIKASMGFSTLMGLVGYLMTHADDEDAVLKISASGPRDFNKKYELKKAGWKPFTITIGDASFSYQDHPLYFILAAAGTLYESDKYGNSIDGEGNADLFSYVALTTAMSMLQQSWLQGLSDLGRILNSDDPAKAIANKTFGVLNAVAMPNFHKQLVRGYMEIMDDPIKARRNGTITGAIDQLYRDIPIANSGLYDMVDNYGDPIVPEQGKKLIPIDLSWGEKGDPLAKHLVGEGVYVGKASNRKIEDYDINDERYLNDDEYQVYKMESAKAVGKILRENSSYLKSLKGEELGLVVRDLKKEARDNTLYDLFYYDGYKKIKK